MTSCKYCNVLFEVDSDLLCSSCAGHYHYECLGILESAYKKMTAENKASWQCLECRQPGMRDALLIIAQKIRHLKANISTVKNEINTTIKEASNIETQFSIIDSKLHDIDARLTQAENKIKRVPLVEGNFDKLKSKLNNLKKNEAKMEQFSRMNNLEISGVPQKNGENLLSILINISVSIGFQLNETDIDTIYRVKRAHSSVEGRQHVDRRPPVIIAQFCQRIRRDGLLSAARAHRNITTADAGLPDPTTPVYINDDLTAANKLLLKKARDFKNNNNFKYLWVKQCKIHIRKDDNSKIHVISENTDFNKLR